MYLLGFDIGGTKCAAVTASWDGERIELLKKVKCETDLKISPEMMLERLMAMADSILEGKPDGIGISCGGPLDSERGEILGPPNLPGWDEVHAVSIIEEHYGVRAKLENDANACAVAEWKFGAGRGYKNLVFLTFGTGLGAGLIIDGKLYSGTNGNAGELGHVRLAEDGPIGYGKCGSFEGFCSGGGIARLGLMKARELSKTGRLPAYCEGEIIPENITAKKIADAARLGDATALEVFRISGERLGAGLAIIADILNPEIIVIGSIYARCKDLLGDVADGVFRREALSEAYGVCRVAPAELGENIGDFAAVATALL